MKEAKELKVRETKTYLDVSNNGNTTSFVYPPFGPSTAINVGTKILESKLEQPTMAQTARLVNAAWQNPGEKYSAEIIQMLRHSQNRLWAFNGLLYCPNLGIYIEDKPQISGGQIIMNQCSLDKRLESGDPSVRFVEFGSFVREEQSSLELTKNKFVMSLAGEEGAEQLAQLTDKYPGKAYVWTFDRSRVREPICLMASLNSSRPGNEARLGICGQYYSFEEEIGSAFGISK